MDEIDKEVHYYERMLGLDRTDPDSKNIKKQLKQELENDNMLELFTCVDSILGRDYGLLELPSSEDEENTKHRLEKREPVKSKVEVIREQDLGDYTKKLRFVKVLL
jgi:hypothetical protein